MESIVANIYSPNVCVAETASINTFPTEATDIDYDVLAQESEGLTGADINAFIKQAMACTMEKMMESISPDEPLVEVSTLLTMNDLCLALKKLKARRDAAISSEYNPVYYK